MLKLMPLIGTCPELMKMGRVIAKLDRLMHHVLVHPSQNYDYELNQVFFDDPEFSKPGYFDCITGEQTAAKTIADVIAKADDVLAKEMSLVMCGLKQESVLDAVRVVTNQCDRTRRVIPPIRDYQAPEVSKQIVRVMLSYTGYINRTAWSKV